MIIPLVMFAFTMCITPGPNNMMLTASGANYGFKRTIPHILGIEIGLLVMFLLSGFGLGILFQAYPVIQQVMKYGSITYLLYLSLRIATTTKAKEQGTATGKPLSFFQAASFQLVNPKLLMMTVMAMATFSESGQGYTLSVILVTTIFGLVCIPSISVWAGFGTMIGKVLKKERSYRLFNTLMGLLTAASVVQVL